MPARDDDQSFPLCAACGDRIGVYERIWVTLPDGGVERSSLLALTPQRTAQSAQLFHAGCLAPESGPAAP